MPLGLWPAGERPREKLLKAGPKALSDAELLAVVLGSGIAGADAISLARELLVRTGGLAGLLERGPRAAEGLKGLGP
ncbi:MAG: UPF0758 domain-containing protein, partial [Gammaproteobacteria bacterium]